MTAVVKFQLNPLADVFVPTNCQNTSQSKKKNRHWPKIENETKTARKGIRKQKLNNMVPENKFKAIALRQTSQVWQHLVFGGLTTVLNVFLKNRNFNGQNTGRMLENQPLPLISLCSEDDKKLSKKCNVKVSETLKFTEDKIECSCPAMFGWVVPPDFIGNPFNFKYECGKNYPHSPDSTDEYCFDSDTIDYIDTKVNKLTLDECFSEIKDILADVYETISIDQDPIINCDEKYETKESLVVFDKVDDNEESNESKSVNLDSISEISDEPELIDDGIHPLLQSTPNREEDEKDLVEKVEKILEKSLSSLPKSSESETFTPETICDPPCSIWCDFLPSAAKDTFKKYIKKMGNSKDCKEASLKSCLGHRPIFKRSLSDGDAPMCGRLGQTSALESKEMLLLRRNDPLRYFRIRSSNPLRNVNRHGSCDFLDRQLFTNSCESGMWGKFDGVDSLWKPLPECTPESNFNQKQNAKRGREAKQQKSVN